MITANYSMKESLAGDIAHLWSQWDDDREGAKNLWKEIDLYIHATDTSSLDGGENFEHKTHIPFLGELYEDLIAIIYSTVFPHENWLGWKGFDTNAITKALRRKVLGFLKQTHALNGFDEEARKIIDDYVRYGNCFGMAYYRNEAYDGENGVVTGFSGACIKRISPYDIVFNPASVTFEKSPKIIREMVTLIELQDLYDSVREHSEVSEEEFKEILMKRSHGGMDDDDKDAQYLPQGFNSIQAYYSSGYVELLWFYGDIYDPVENTFHRNRCIVVVDGSCILFDREQSKPCIFKGGWKDRPDNLWSQGALDNVVGINYMINHRENGRNDAIDKFIYPDRAYVGDVEEIYDEQTGHTKYLMPENGSVTDIRPDTTVLTFDNQIMLHRELGRNAARLPQQLAGFRTAGEKTALEVQSLNDGAFRGFINKAERLEYLFQKLVQSELRISKDNFQSVIRVLEEDEEGTQLTAMITEEDLSANGKLIPEGSKRFAKQLQQLNGIQTIANSNLGQMISPHINTYNLARTVEHLYQFDNYQFIDKFTVIDEQVEMQKKQMYAQQLQAMESANPTSLEMQMDAEMGGMEDEL